MGSRTDGRRSTNTPSFRDNFDCRNKTRLSRYTIFLTKVATSFLDPILYTNHFNYVQGYSKRMKLQRRLQGILYCLVSFMIPWNCKLMSFLSKSFKKPLKGYTQSRRLILTLGSSYLGHNPCGSTYLHIVYAWNICFFTYMTVERQH